jgi:hypothetical protein
MNVNETMKTPQDLITNKDKLQQYGGAIPTSFELDPNTTSTHVSSGDEFDHVSKKDLHKVVG